LRGSADEPKLAGLPKTVITVIVTQTIGFVQSADWRWWRDQGDGMNTEQRGRPTLARQVHAGLREWLIAGVLSPGEKLSLRSVGERLGVSMTPVREAVSRLVADAALEVLPNRAVSVPVLSLEEFQELTAIRVAIEGFAAGRAAALRSPQQLAAIRRYDALFRRQCGRTRPNIEAAVKANQALHFAVYAAAGLPALMPMIEGLWLRIGPVLNLDMRASPERLRLGAAERCHGRLVAAIDARDEQAARRALADDIGGAAAFIESRGVLSARRPAQRRER
jgi:DNA-binding GntR family transcriptional regulator